METVDYLGYLIGETIDRLPKEVLAWLQSDTTHIFPRNGQDGERFLIFSVNRRAIFVSERLVGFSREEALWTIAHDIARSRLGHDEGCEKELKADRLVAEWGFAEPRARHIIDANSGTTWANISSEDVSNG
jgi:hypothetical protein